jgi:hypothetical protein
MATQLPYEAIDHRQAKPGATPLFLRRNEGFKHPIMREGGYVRYDGRKSTQVLRDCERLLADYSGSLRRLHDAARDARELEATLLTFYGVGPVTVNIFLRELHPYWGKVDPQPLPIVKRLAKKLKLDLARYPRKSLVFTRVEASLIRWRRELS